MVRLLAGLLFLFACQALAWPEKPVRIIVPFAPGGSADTLGRLVAQKMSEHLKASFVVENRAGAGGAVGSELAARAAPDGYTLVVSGIASHVIAPLLPQGTPYDPVRDFTHVALFGGPPAVLAVNPSMEAKDLREFVALAKARPGSVNYASAGLGSTTHLAADHFARLAGVELVHVPYKGVGPALADLIAGRVQMLSVGLGPVQSHLKSGSLKALTVASKRRLDALPDLPTSAEAGVPGYEMTTWFGVFAPKATSPKIIQLLNARLQAIIDDPKIRKGLLDSGIEPIGGSVKTFTELVAADYKAWGQVVRASGVKLE